MEMEMAARQSSLLITNSGRRTGAAERGDDGGRAQSGDVV